MHMELSGPAGEPVPWEALWLPEVEYVLAVLADPAVQVSAAGAARLMRAAADADQVPAGLRVALEGALERAAVPRSEVNGFGVMLLVRDAIGRPLGASSRR